MNLCHEDAWQRHDERRRGLGSAGTQQPALQARQRRLHRGRQQEGQRVAHAVHAQPVVHEQRGAEDGAAGKKEEELRSYNRKKKFR